MSDNRINSVSVSCEGPRQTPNQSFGKTLAKTLASGASGAMGLASPIVGAVNPALSAPVSQGAQIIGAFATSNTSARQMATGASLGGTPVGSSSTSGSIGGEAGSVSGSSDGDGFALLQATKEMNEQNQSFNLQYLQLQEQMQKESREYQTVSNIMKVRHDSATAAINNIH